MFNKKKEKLMDLRETRQALVQFYHAGFLDGCECKKYTDKNVQKYFERRFMDKVMTGIKEVKEKQIERRYNNKRSKRKNKPLEKRP